MSTFNMSRSNYSHMMFAVMFLLATLGEAGASPVFEHGDTPEAVVVATTTGIGQLMGRRFQALWELSFMVKCTTGKGLLTAIYDYAWYGCYCGFGGKGEPVDGVDRCCMIHDNCYDIAFRTRKCPLEPDVYFIPYRGHYRMASCQTSRPVVRCDSPSSYPWWHPYPECAAAICHCDAVVSMCLGRNTFHPNNAWYHKRACRHEPLVTVGTAATAIEDTTPIYPFETTFTPGTVSELPSDTTSTTENPTEPRETMAGPRHHDFSEGAPHRPANGNQIDDGGVLANSESRRSQKMTQYKQDNWPTYFKKHPWNLV